MKYFLSLFLVLMSTHCYPQNNALADYLEKAIKNSPLLKDLDNQILSAKLDSIRIRAGFRPQVTANSTGLYAPVINGYGYSAAITNGQSLNGLISVSKAFIGRNYLKAQFAGISLQADSLRNTIKLSEQDLLRTITGQYITAYGSLQQQKFNEDIVGLLLKEEGLLKELTRSNVYRQSDYLTFLVTLKQAQLQLAQSKLQYKTDYATLNYLTGIADTTVVFIEKPDLQRAVIQDVKTSIFFKQFKLDSIKLANNRRLIDYTYRPRLSVFADGGHNSDLTYQYNRNFGTSFGFTLSVPIYDGGQRKLLYKSIYLEQQTILSYRTFFSNQYVQQINQLNQQILAYDKLIADINKQFIFSESLIKVNTKLLQTGDLKIADLILAVNNYLAIRNLLTQNTISKLQLINQLNYWNR